MLTLRHKLFWLLLLPCLAWPGMGWAARLFTCGLEENNLTGTMFSSTSGNAPTIGSTAPHSGTYRLNTAAAAGNSYATGVAFTSKTSGTLFSRFYFRTSDATPSANASIHSDSSTGPVVTAEVLILTTGALRIVNNVSTTTATTTLTLSVDTWYRIEMDHLLSDTVGAITLRVYDDGNPATLLETATITGEDTLSTNVGTMRWGKTASDATFSFDDIAVNDETGATDTTTPGAGKIYMLVPNADVSIVWLDQAAAAATFARIDGLPTAVDDADYNEDATANGTIDRLGLTNLGAEVPSDATIKVVSVFGRVGSNQTAATHLRFKVWDDAATLTNGPSVTANVNGWRLVTWNEQLTLNTAGKTKTNLDSFNVGYENITDLGTRPRRISELWANVEWTEAGAGGGTVPAQGFGWFLGGQ